MKIYLFPFLIDCIAFLVFLAVSDAAGREMKLSDAQTATLFVVYSITYLVAGVAVGRVLTTANARRILLFSVATFLLLCVPILYCHAFWPMLALLAVFGVTMAGCFNSFQTFMRGEVPAGKLASTIARYTLAWSSGIALGFLAGGWLKGKGGGSVLAVFAVVGGLIALAMIATHKPRDVPEENADGAIEAAREGHMPVDARYVAIGWILCFCANLCQRPLMTFLPKFYAEAGAPAALAGTLFFVMMLAQALFGRGGHHMRGWLYRPRPLVLFQLLNIALVAILWAKPSTVLTGVTMALMGCVYGWMYFAGIYYVSNDRLSSRNVGINEAMIGGSAIVGIMFCEAVMRILKDREAFYPALMAALFLLLGLQLLLLRRKPQLVPAAEPDTTHLVLDVPM